MIDLGPIPLHVFDFRRCIRDGMLCMTSSFPSFDQQAAALSDPQYAEALATVTHVILAPDLALDDHAAQQVAAYLSTVQSVTRLTFVWGSWLHGDVGKMPGEERTGRIKDLWLAAAASNSNFPLLQFANNCSGSIAVLRDFARAKLAGMTVEIDPMEAAEHYLGVYLDPSLGIRAIDLLVQGSDQADVQRTADFLAEMGLVMPTSNALQELKIRLPWNASSDQDCSAAALSSPSVHTLEIENGCLGSSIPANNVLRKLTLDGTHFWVEAARALGNLTAVESLSMKSCTVWLGRPFVLEPLLTCQLKFLNLEKTPVTAGFLSHLSEFLLSDVCALKCLCIEGKR